MESKLHNVKYYMGRINRPLVNLYNIEENLLEYEMIPASKTKCYIPEISKIINKPLYLKTQLHIDEVVKILNSYENWILVSADSIIGWIHIKNVDFENVSVKPQKYIDIVYGTRNELRQLVCEEARKYLGVPYLWGGRSFKGIDCSALVQLSYKNIGIKLPRFSQGQYNKGRVIKDKLKIGDLIFIEDVFVRRIVHVVILTHFENNLIIEACGLPDQNITHELNFKERFGKKLDKLKDGDYLKYNRRIYFRNYIHV